MEVIETAVSNYDLQSKSRFYDVNSSSGLQNSGYSGEPSNFSSMDSPKQGSESDSPSGNTGSGVEMSVESPAGGGDLSDSNHATDGGRSHSKAAVKVQKVYRSYRTRRRLADSAVVIEQLWWLALDYAMLNHSTIAFFDYLKPESAVSRFKRVGLNASKVGQGLSKDAKAKQLAFQHWIEAIDPRHRYGHNLHIYYEKWSESDAVQPFFYWLDVGDGKDIDLKECPRSKLRKQCIKYLGPQEREHYEYIVVEGKIIHKKTRDVLDTIEGIKGGKCIFVMSTSKKLYVGEKKKGMFQHSSFLAGGVTLAAGRLEAELGVLKSISAYSGHYRPTEESLQIFLSLLKENGVNLSEVEICRATDESDDDGRSSSARSIAELEVSTTSVPTELKVDNAEKDLSSESSVTNQTDNPSTYTRTLSGGLQSPRAEVSKKVILERINSKKAAKSYQLGHQLSLKWSTGAGPRIGCVADYPVELRQQALEFVNLSPRTPQTPLSFPSPRTPRTPLSFPSPRTPRTLDSPSAYKRPGKLASTSAHSTSNDSNADGTVSGI